MAENKRSFILYADYLHTVSKLTKPQAGRLFKLIFKYVNNIDIAIPNNLKKPFEEAINIIESECKKFNPKTVKYHWNYKGGITPQNKALRNSSLMAYWRFLVFERDHFTCQEKGCGKVGGELHAHHIKEFAKFPDLRFDVNNGITLCKKCHIELHKKSTV